MKSVGIGLLGRDEGPMEGPNIRWGAKTVRISFEGEGYAFIDLDQKLEVASGPPGPPGPTSSTSSDDRDNSTDRRLP